MVASIISRAEVKYPEGDEFFSPAERFPEYRFQHLAQRPNPVYGMVRELFVQAGLDRQRLGTPDWNPLGEYIPRGSSVFVLCNFVYHRRFQDSSEDLFAKCTHGSVLRALIDYIALAAGPTATIRFGNSPLQSCDWDQVLKDTGADQVARFYQQAGVSVIPTDLRLHVIKRNPLGKVTLIEERSDRDVAVEVDLQNTSLLAEIGDPQSERPRFRIADYNPNRIESFHSAGSHRYVIHRHILESDVIVSVPKLKTHEKVGITCGLKGFVGTVGHKDCLAHHRFGNPRIGGDEYPDRFRFLRPLSAFEDWLNQRDPDAPAQGGFQILDRTLQRLLRRLGVTRSGAWSGNDTAWRMTLDLARIVHYAGADGRLHAERQRRHLMLIDGILGGEGDGPLAPTPAAAGCLLFGDDVVLGDRVACRLMGFDPDAIPLIREASRHGPYPIAPEAVTQPAVWFNGKLRTETELVPILGRPFRAPAGWRTVCGDRR